MKVVPFDIARNGRRKVADQVADGFREAILTGRYAEGALLPAVREIAKDLGIGLVAACRSMQILADEGLVVSRPHVGTIVASRGEKVWRGRIVFVGRDVFPSYYSGAIAARLQDRLARRGYIFTHQVVLRGDDGRYDFSALDFALKGGVDLVLQMNDNAEISRHLAAIGIPFLAIRMMPRPPRGSVGSIRSVRTSATDEFVRRCLAAGVRKVLQVGAEPFPDSLAQMRAAGLAAEEWVAATEDASGPASVGRSALAAFGRRLSDGWPDLPELLFFTDDFAASGALLALVRHGVRIPDDVFVVTLSNLGVGPVFHKSLARLEMDGAAHGDAIADYVLAFLRSGAFPAPLTLEPRYEAGDTFPF